MVKSEHFTLLEPKFMANRSITGHFLLCQVTNTKAILELLN